MPELVRAEITRRYAELGETVGVPSPPVAVRSSAVGEDSAEATFAGQQESVLWVCGSDAVCDAVRDLLGEPPQPDGGRLPRSARRARTRTRRSA